MTDWKAWFERHGATAIARPSGHHAYPICSIEDLYQAFKARIAADIGKGDFSIPLVEEEETKG